MSSTTAEVFAGLDAALAAVADLDWDHLPIRQRLQALDRLETARRRAGACASDLVVSVQRCGEKALGGPVPKVLADVLRITPAEARRRIRDATQLAPRTTLTGQPLPPELPATATAWHTGLLDIDHLRVIQKFCRELPDEIHPDTAAKVEAFLADKATQLRPDKLEKLSHRLAQDLNPDGRFSEDYRAAQRGFQWCGGQRPDGTSVGKLIATPELRSMLDAWLAKFAAPGMCNPADQSPTLSGEPSPQRRDRDSRTHPQRQHDALTALLRRHLGNPELGQHNGLPVTVIVSTTLDQLRSAAGHAVTAAGTLLPIPDLIRMAAHAHHYLTVFNQHTEQALYLGRTKRIATADQRIVLHAKDRGCTAPGCDMPGYLCEVHHVDEWTGGGRTDIDRLTFACPAHHRLITPGGWTTRKHPDGTTEWIPPPQLPLSGGINTYHHPERLLP